jgi:hypothetical protein
MDDYIRAFRRIVADIYAIDRGPEKYDYINAGRDGWLAMVDVIRLADITRTQVEQRRADYLAGHGQDLDLLRAARTSTNSMLRMCKALFSPDRLARLGLSALINPFEKVKLDSAADMRFRGGIDAQKLANVAFRELDGECLKAFVLSLSSGLRRNESDKLEWAAIHL